MQQSVLESVLRMPAGRRSSLPLRRICFAALLLCALFPPRHALAQPVTILITASRFAETADETLAPVSVITREDIERMQAETVEEVLRTVPGVTLTNFGGSGKLTSLFLRGANSNHVLVLIDGVKAGSATTGATPFEGLPLAHIEKIEVVRGPRSSLYGSEAIGGVIQIFTRRGGGARTAASIATGSHDARSMSMNISGGRGETWYQLGASALSTGGFNACRGSQSPFAGCFLAEDALEADRDGHKNRSVSFRGGMRAGPRVRIEGGLLGADNETEFDGAFQNETRTGVRTASIKAVLRAGEAWQSELSLGQSRDLSGNFKDGAHRSTFDTIRNQVNWQNQFLPGENHRIIAGMDYLDDQISGGEIYAVDSRANTGVFVSWRIKARGFDAEASVRTDDNEQFGGKTTGGIAWGKSVNATRISASYGTAFTAPTFNDLYSRGDFYRGNPGLLPEKSDSIDLGFSRSAAHGNFSLNVFRTRINDLISVTSDYRTSENIDKAVITGIEISAGMRAPLWTWSAGITAQDPKDAGGGVHHGKRLQRRAQTILHLDAERKFGRHALGASLHSQGFSYDAAGNKRKLDGFTRVDARAKIHLRGGWTLALKAGNLFDETYETAAYYPQDGANFMATLRYESGAR
ncbi:MAG: TonB-dependent receptor [Gammaproteobacteria bacterium]